MSRMVTNVCGELSPHERADGRMTGFFARRRGVAGSFRSAGSLPGRSGGRGGIAGAAVRPCLRYRAGKSRLRQFLRQRSVALHARTGGKPRACDPLFRHRPSQPAELPRVDRRRRFRHSQRPAELFRLRSLGCDGLQQGRRRQSGGAIAPRWPEFCDLCRGPAPGRLAGHHARPTARRARSMPRSTIRFPISRIWRATPPSCPR